MTEPDTMTYTCRLMHTYMQAYAYVRVGLCVYTCGPMRIYVQAYATVCVTDACAFKNRQPTQSVAKRP